MRTSRYRKLKAEYYHGKIVESEEFESRMIPIIEDYNVNYDVILHYNDSSKYYTLVCELCIDLNEELRELEEIICDFREMSKNIDFMVKLLIERGDTEKEINALLNKEYK